MRKLLLCLMMLCSVITIRLNKQAKPTKQRKGFIMKPAQSNQPEPVAYDVNGATVYIKPPIHNGKYLTGYAAPPQREWQGLTDEEIDQAAWPHFIGNILPSVKLIVRQLEAKLKEKNND